MTDITKDQIRAIRTIASRMFPDDDAYHNWLMNNYHVASTKDLSKQMASQIIEMLGDPTHTKISEESKGRYYGGGNPGSNRDHLTQAQADEIARLEDALGWTENPKRLRGFIVRQIGKHCTVEMLMNYEARKVISGMKKMKGGVS